MSGSRMRRGTTVDPPVRHGPRQAANTAPWFSFLLPTADGRRPTDCFLLVCLLSLATCGKPATTTTATATPWTDPAPHKNAFVTVNGIRMNYLDWGGSGPVLILIHGAGDNPHVFNDLAPAFTDRFHVIAYARRGHGDTEAKGPYNVATLTEDLRTLMDSLHITTADLAGWSMGGDEITAMAATHPQRVHRLVYLEGAYDWADPKFSTALQAFPEDFNPPASTLTSLDAFRDYQQATFFPKLSDMSRVEAYVRDLVVDQPDGHSTMRMSDSASAGLLQVLRSDHREYTKIHAPVLAIYATTFLDLQHGDSTQRAKIAAWERSYMAPFRAASMARVRREIPGIQIVQVPGTHMSFLFDSRDRVVAAMRRFLEDSTTQRPASLSLRGSVTDRLVASTRGRSNVSDLRDPVARCRRRPSTSIITLTDVEHSHPRTGPPAAQPRPVNG